MNWDKVIMPGEVHNWEASWTKGNSSLIQRFDKLSLAVQRVVMEPAHDGDTLTIKHRDGKVLWSGHIGIDARMKIIIELDDSLTIGANIDGVTKPTRVQGLALRELAVLAGELRWALTNGLQW